MPLLGMFKMIPSWAYKLLAIALICLGIFLAGEHRVQAQWDAQKALDKEHAAVVVTKQEDTTKIVQEVQQKKEVEIQTVFKDRVVYRTKVVPHEVIVKEDAACIIPDRFISMWNSANAGSEIPATPGSADAATNGSGNSEGTR